MAMTIPRLIYSLLAIRMMRLARLDLARADMLSRDADAAFDLSRDRVRQAAVLAARAELRRGADAAPHP